MTEGKHEQAEDQVRKDAGDHTGDDDLERDGQIDETTGKVDQDAEHAVETVRDHAHRD